MKFLLLTVAAVLLAECSAKGMYIPKGYVERTCSQMSYQFKSSPNAKLFYRNEAGTADFTLYSCLEPYPFFNSDADVCMCEAGTWVAPEREVFEQPEEGRLADNECFDMYSGNILRRTGLNRYATFAWDSGKGTTGEVLVEESVCAADRLFFRLSTCSCDRLNLLDTLTEDQCLDSVTGEIVTKISNKDFSRGGVLLRCQAGTVWDVQQCACVRGRSGN